MSTNDLLIHCIPVNPDITGIGIRVLIYAQNLLSFVPAFYALQDRKVTPIELTQLETQSSTILITAFAILLSTVIQGLARNLTPYHAAVVLNHSWMNNTNLCVYFLLYFYRKVSIFREENQRSNWSESYTITRTDEKRRALWVEELRRTLHQPVLWIGSAHLTLMATVGIWLWSGPANFGDSNTCSLSTSLFVLGGRVDFNAPGLRDWSIFIYSLLLTPVLNLLFPIAFFAVPFLLYKQMVSNSSDPTFVIWPVRVGLGVLVTINIILLVATETAIVKNKPLLETGDNQWTFGQTLALLLLLLPSRDILEALYERRAKELGKKLLNATKQGDTGVIQDTIKTGAPKDMLDDALYIATQNGNVKTVATLIDAEPSEKAKDLALGTAAKNGKLEIVKILVEKGNTKTYVQGPYANHWSLLYLAAKRKDRDVVKMLIKNGHDVNQKGLNGGTVLHCVAQESNIDIDIVRIFFDHAEKDRIVLSAVKDSSFDKIKPPQGAYLLMRQHNVHSAATSDGKTPLDFATQGGTLDIVKFFLDKGPNVYAEMGGGNFDTVKFLFDKGAEVHSKSKIYTYISDIVASDILDLAADEITPLHLAAEGGDLNISRLLLDQGADITPLHFAARGGNLDIVTLLLDKEADVHTTTTFDEKTPLYFATQGGTLDIVKLLLDKGADMYARTRGGNLHIVKLLLDKKADVHAKTSDGTTPLHSAIQGARSLDISRLLLDNGAHVNVTTTFDETLLHFCSVGWEH
ncbi:hypothetical protein C0995_001093 [Termitomyces sp. Mi166|nr:hypothetical protein C0995_001093 [Termitomyces sp. Mi166\